jgi:uncharacterized membrane protein
MKRQSAWEAVRSVARIAMIGGLIVASVMENIMRKSGADDNDPCIDYDSIDRIKFIDLHKMYADRVTAIRAIMIPLIAVMTALLGLMATLRDMLGTQTWIVQLITATLALTFVVAIFLKWRIGQLVSDYELYGRLAHKYSAKKVPVLPIDSLMTSVEYAKRGYTELGKWWCHRISTMILLIPVVVGLMFGGMAFIGGACRPAASKITSVNGRADVPANVARPNR